MTDLDAYPAAALIIRQRDYPELYVCGPVDDMIAAGDPKGEAWKRILTAIRALQTTTPHGGDGLN